MNTTLIIMAAGFGSRYGGNKQVEGFGPGGEYLMEYSMYDAVRAGFTKIVVVIKRDILDLVSGVLADASRKLRTPGGEPVEISYAFQEFDSLPEGYELPEGRTKPFGTVHAVLCARAECDGPFAVINADDFYGEETFRIIHKGLMGLKSGREAAMAAFRLGNTVSSSGAVTRGVCSIADGCLSGVRETREIHLDGEGIVSGTGEILCPDTPVSMNIWGFRPEIWDKMQKYFDDFLQGPIGRELKSECLLPDMVDSLIKSGELKVSAPQTGAKWFGVTYKADAEETRRELALLCDKGVYPAPLW